MHTLSPPYERSEETSAIYRAARVDDLFCDAMNLRNTEWLSRVDADDVFELAAAILLADKEEGRAKAYAIFEAIAEAWAENEEEAER